MSAVAELGCHCLRKRSWFTVICDECKNTFFIQWSVCLENKWRMWSKSWHSTSLDARELRRLRERVSKYTLTFLRTNKTFNFQEHWKGRDVIQALLNMALSFFSFYTINLLYSTVRTLVKSAFSDSPVENPGRSRNNTFVGKYWKVSSFQKLYKTFLKGLSPLCCISPPFLFLYSSNSWTCFFFFLSLRLLSDSVCGTGHVFTNRSHNNVSGI